MFSSCFAVARVTDRCTRQTDSFRGKRKYDPQFGFFFLECVIIVASMVRKRSCEVCLCCSYGREQCCHSWLVCQRSLCPSISGPGLSPAPETVAETGAARHAQATRPGAVEAPRLGSANVPASGQMPGKHVSFLGPSEGSRRVHDGPCLFYLLNSPWYS